MKKRNINCDLWMIYCTGCEKKERIDMNCVIYVICCTPYKGRMDMNDEMIYVIYCTDYKGRNNEYELWVVYAIYCTNYEKRVSINYIWFAWFIIQAIKEEWVWIMNDLRDLLYLL